MKTFKGATSPTSIWKHWGCSITNQYMETLRGVIYLQYMETLRGATSPVYGHVEGCNTTSIWKR
jgi:hypothetical protein